MGYLRGLDEYLKQNYDRDVFKEFKLQRALLHFHFAGHQELTRKIKKSMTFDLDLRDREGQIVRYPKLHIKFYYPAKLEQAVKPLIDVNPEVEAMNLEPIRHIPERYHIKNKTLYPLMMERQAVVITLLEGEVLRGFIDDFTRYEIFLKFRDDLRIIVLRHAIYRFQDFRGRDLLKNAQEESKDWQKSSLWVEEDETEETES